VPSLDIVVARAGPAKSWKREPGAHPYDVLQPFLGNIVAAVQQPAAAGKKAAAKAEGKARERVETVAPENPPYPQSKVITGVEWAPASEIVRHARGGDNWPSTWGADDYLYSAYGDANGWEPFLPKKLSMGIVRVAGNPPNIRGENVSSPTAEVLGDGNKGRKASGMLMLDDGTLYILVRNVGNAQLGWSRDQGKTWTWADWKFTTSFGCPTFLNFGKAYAGSRDHFVYIYSHDSDSAYERADGTVLARVPKERIRDRQAYVFFVNRAAEDRAVWTTDVHRRDSVFENPGNCYRTSVSYNAGLKRYLMCQINAGADTRFSGGFGIYDAPEPWGPWTTVYYTPKWDVGPGETNSLPTKWMSADGKTVHLLFSGDDYFSVRKATLKTK
jgi:hypothetical protein